MVDLFTLLASGEDISSKVTQTSERRARESKEGRIG
jgi:hypothetical protein